MNIPDVFERLRARRAGRDLAPNVQVLDAAGSRLTLMDPGSALADTPDSLLAVDEATMSAGFVVSTSRRDRVGDVVVPDGCLDTLADYAANPVVFYAHRTSDPPIAKAMGPDGKLALWFERDRILSRAFFHGKTRESDEVFKLVAERILQAASIGFVPDEAELLDAPDVEQQLSEGRLEFDFGGFVFRRWHLLEWSVVPVPANPDALRSYLDSGRVKSPTLRRSLASMAAPRKASLWLDAQSRMVCKGMLEDLVAPPSNHAGSPAVTPPEVDAMGRPADKAGEPQAVVFSPELFPAADDVTAWLELNGLAGAKLSEPNEGGGEYVALLFPADRCDAESVRHEKVEEGVTMVFCLPKQAEDAPVPEPTPAAAPQFENSAEGVAVTKDAPAQVAKSDPEPPPEVKRAAKPMGAEVLECVCGMAEGMHRYMKDCSGRMEPETKAFKHVSKLIGQVAKMHGATCDVGSAAYPEHFGVKAIEDDEAKSETPGGMVPEERKADLSALLSELGESKSLSTSQRIACASFAAELKAAPPAAVVKATPAPAQAAKAEEPPAVDPAVEEAMRELQRVFFELTGKEV